jgi:hypothetical protein
MTTRTATSSWTLELVDIDHDFETLKAEVSLDETNTVYCHASITVAPYPDAIDADVRAAIADGTQRGLLTAALDILTPSVASQSRGFDLYVHERRRNEDETVTFELASDEAELEIRGLVADYRVDYHVTPGTDDTARGVIDRVLDDYLGTSLESGTVDAVTTRTLALTNLIVNGGFEVNIASWAARSNASGLVRSTLQSASGVASLRWTATGSGTSSIQHTKIAIPAGTPGKLRRYVGQAALRSTTSRSAYITVQQLDGNDTVLSSDASATVATLTSDWTLYETYVQVLDPRVVALQFVASTLGNAGGNQHYIDDVSLIQIPEESLVDDETPGPHAAYYPYALIRVGFDGDSSDAYYDYAWLGDTGASPSQRTPKDDRGFDLVLMEPGQTAREFLDPIVGVAGGRLFCDENRDWRLVDDSYTVAGTLALDYITRATDTVSLSESFNGVPTVFTGVVVVYTITTTDGTVKRRYDFAGDNSGRVYRREVQSAYPGPGEAAAILARVQGRSFAIDVLTDLTATPSKAMTFSKNGVDFEGIISRVQWSWSTGSETDQMVITPRDLTEV